MRRRRSSLPSSWPSCRTSLRVAAPPICAALATTQMLARSRNVRIGHAAWMLRPSKRQVGPPSDELRHDLPGLGDPRLAVLRRRQAVGLQQRVGVLVPARLREVVPENGDRRLRLVLDAERHVALGQAHQRLFDVRRRLVFRHHRLEAVDRARRSSSCSGSSARLPFRRPRACPRQCGCGCRRPGRTCCRDSASSGSSAARAPCASASDRGSALFMSSK